MTETKSGNPFFGKKDTRAFSEACAEMNTQECIDRLTELHHCSEKVMIARRSKKIKRSKWN